MVNIKPIDFGNSISVLQAFASALVVSVVGALVGSSFNLSDLLNFFFSLLNWYIVAFICLLLIASNLSVYFLMNNFWKFDYYALKTVKTENTNLHKALEKAKVDSNDLETAKTENEVLRKALEEADILRKTDIITGIPNSEALKNDISNNYSVTDKIKQCIFIDLQDFGKINEKYGFIRGNELIKTIGQTIYNRMRRNEKIYKIPQTNLEPTSNNRVYRVFPGGDEFVIIIFGEQWEALGFSNRLVDMFNEITMKTPDILGSRENLFFSCIIVEMEKVDSYDHLLSDIHGGYKTAKEGGPGFSIYWHPRNIEKTLSPTKDQKKLKEYEQARKKFNVTIPSDNEYGL